MQTEVNNTTGVEVDDYGIPTTEVPAAAPRKPQADIATVGSVYFTRLGDYPVLKVSMTTEIGLGIEDVWFLSEEMVENFTITKAKSTYSSETLSKFSQIITNEKRDAKLDRYKAAAKEKEAEDGKERNFTRVSGTKSVEELAEVLTDLLSDVQVLVTRKPDNRGYLKVNTVRPVSEKYSPRFISFIGRGGYNINYEQ